MRPMRCRILSAALATVLTAPLLCLGSGSTSASYVFFFVEDFDGDWPPDFYALEPVPGSWRVVDNNAASGVDYWGRTSERAYSGTYSAWCAQNGYNSLNYALNSVNGYYDQDMQSCMMVYLGNIEGYESVTFAFTYWAETGSTLPNDYLEVRLFDGESWNRAWLQPNAGNMTWETVAFEIPTSTTWIGFFFISDAELGLGPYEGVYIDNIFVAGNDVDPPSSSAGPLDEYWVGEVVYVPCLANDSFGAGVDFVELYYRSSGADNFEKYAPPDNPEGEWNSGFIPFNTSLAEGDGSYEFYTIATDVAGNVELGPGSPDAYVIVDNAPPETEAVITDDDGVFGWYSSSVDVLLWSDDDLSGVDSTFYRIGEIDWQTYEAAVTIVLSGLNELQYYSVDRAGNREQVRFVDLKIDTDAPEIEVTSPETGSEFEEGAVLVSWTSSDGTSGVHHVVVNVDGKWSEYCNSSTTEILISGLEDGEYVLSVTAFDCAGNTAEATVSIIVAAEEDGDGIGKGLSMEVILMIVAACIALAVLALYLVGRRRRGGQGSDSAESAKEGR